MNIYDPVTMAEIRTDVKQCCECKRFLDERGEYIEKPQNEEIAYSHTYCKECAEKMMESIAAL